MPKNFNDIINILYIEGFFEKGYINHESYKPKPLFLLNLFKGSVDNPELIRVSQPSLNGYISGTSINSIAEDSIEAGLNKNLLSDYIKGLYPTNHKDSKTYNDRYGKMNYGEALYQKASNEFKGLTMENMADKLANEIYTIITDAASSSNTKNSNVLNVEDTPSMLIDSYIITADEKDAIKNICRMISDSLNKLQETAHKISILFPMVRNNSNYDNESNWRIELWRRIRNFQESYNNEHETIRKHCKAFLIILKTKNNIDESIKNICAIAEDFCNNKYYYSKDNFDDAALENVLTEFKNNYQSLLAYLDAI